MRLIFELQLPQGGWYTVLRMTPGDRPGSVSHSHASGRDVLLFVVDEHCAEIARVLPGHDALVDDGESRVFAAGARSVLLARLEQDGETFEQDLQTDGMNFPMRARWRLSVDESENTAERS